MAKVEEGISFFQNYVQNSIKDYLQQTQATLFDSVHDTSKQDKVHEILIKLDTKKRGNQFLVSNHLTIVDLLVYSSLIVNLTAILKK